MDEDGLEKAVQTLLRHAYQPVESRGQFRTELLERLKTKQRQSALRRRRQRILHLAGFATVAAAAALMLQVVPLLQTPPSHLPAVSVEPSRTWTPFREEHVSRSSLPQPAPTVAFASGIADPEQPDALAVRPMATMLVSHDDGANWKPWQADQPLRLTAGSVLRPEATRGETGLWLGDGVLLAAWPGSVLRSEKGGVRVEKGEVSALVSRLADSLRILLPDYEIALRPGSKAFVRVEGSDGYAPGGAPSPVVALLEGAACARGPYGEGLLQPEKIYDLFPTFVGGLPARKASAMNTLALRNRTPSLLFADARVDDAVARSTVAVQSSRTALLPATSSEDEATPPAQRRKTVRDRVFILQDGLWTEEGYSAESKLKDIAFDTEPFYEVLRDHQWLKYYLYHLGPRLVIRDGDEFLRITSTPLVSDQN